VTDDLKELGVQEWLAAAQRDDARPECGEPIDASFQLATRHRIRRVVELVAVRAREIAASGRDDLRDHRRVRRLKRARERSGFADSPADRTDAVLERDCVH
jgi:hypothetical protein